MTDLRSRCIEAIAEELEADCNAETAFDAVLGVLTDSADEWAKTAFPYADYEPPARKLLAELGEDA